MACKYMALYSPGGIADRYIDFLACLGGGNHGNVVGWVVYRGEMLACDWSRHSSLMRWRGWFEAAVGGVALYSPDPSASGGRKMKLWRYIPQTPAPLVAEK